MTPEQATKLAKRIANCFRGSPPLAEWVDVFTHDLTDHRAALETIRRLRYTEGALSIDRFASEYRAALAVDAPTVAAYDTGPRLTREQRRDILLRNGAPVRFVDPGANPL